MSGARVAITIVTYNSAQYISGCLEQALQQEHAPLEVIVIDNASCDDTVSLLRPFEKHVRVICNQRNTGFAAAQNQAISAARLPDWVLTLNPDVRLRGDFVGTLLAAAASDDAIGSVCGKLLSASCDFTLGSPPLLDSTGIYFTPSFRHLDRGNGEQDRGQYDRPEYVFGGTGAACLYRKTMIDDVSIAGEFFDPDFFAYREDADVAWRAQLFGWRCLYAPSAVGLHVRAVVPEKRGKLSPLINMHSVKNRWLMRIKNTTPDLYRRYWLPVTARDFVVVGGCLLGEWSSLPAFWRILQIRKSALEKRREIMRRRRATDDYIAAWFRGER
ncbi:MAG TPA: glycosyltransferase family 2 protein [Bryobacteraceae bacterium]|jgi:GT2 family glycosyltransferase|nr:glycosyltransferase family 2 protein [Bryobacteraceae bacterium]